MLEFKSGAPPKGFKTDFESFLFNTKKHRLLQATTGWTEFHLLDPKNKLILSSISFHIAGGKALSPARAPFGSFEISRRITRKDFDDFVVWIEASLESKEISTIEITCPPELYMQRQPLITSVLIKHGFHIALTEPGCSIIVDDKPLTSKMRPNKKTVYRQGQKAMLQFKLLPITQLPKVYDFLADCRREKNQSLSMTFAAVAKTVKALPSFFYLIGVFLKDEWVAASIVIRVSPSIAYTFYLGQKQQFKKLSPSVFLIGQLYDWCRQQGIALLDLGTSALDGKPNINLLNFKLRMGGTRSAKHKFQKALIR